MSAALEMIQMDSESIVSRLMVTFILLSLRLCRGLGVFFLYMGVTCLPDVVASGRHFFPTFQHT